jgi:DNA replication ATP-dependent helicase Dna2
MLKDQGRMHADILTFPNKQYYNNKLQTLADWQHKPLDIKHDIFGKSRMAFINTQAENRRNVNLSEADTVVQLIMEAYQLFEADFDTETLGVITPYRAQIAEIRSRLLEKSPRLYNLVTVDTVERYQGSQRRIIIISMAVNSPYQLKNLHVLNDDGTVDKKLNVAITRAREHLVIVGCSEILSQSPIYNALLQFLED